MTPIPASRQHPSFSPQSTLRRTMRTGASGARPDIRARWRLLAAALCIITAALSAVTATAQERADGTRQITVASAPGSMLTEVWLTLRNGDVIIADRDELTLRGSELVVSGALDRRALPLADVHALTIQPARAGFTSGLGVSLLLSSMLLLSPGDTPGHYLGRQTDSRGDEVFPGLSAVSVLTTLGVSVAAGAVLSTLEGQARTVPLSTGLSAAGWESLLDASWKRWRVRGQLSWVSSSATEDWKDAHERFGFVPYTPYPYSQESLDMEAINPGRLWRLSYAMTRLWEVGVAWQSDGVPRFTQSALYVRPGNPPQNVRQDVSAEMAITGFFATVQYNTPELEGTRAYGFLGAGAGSASKTVRTANFRANTARTELVAERDLGFILFCGVEYPLDRVFSLLFTVDAAFPGTMRLPAQTIADYDGRIYRTLDPFSIDPASIAVGLGVSVGL